MILEVKIEFTFPKENAMDLTAIPIEHDQMRAKKELKHKLLIKRNIQCTV